MKWHKTIEESKVSNGERHTFKILMFGFIPLTMVCDWTGSGKKLHHHGAKDYMIREYYFMHWMIFKKKYKTIITKPNMIYK